MCPDWAYRRTNNQIRHPGLDPGSRFLSTRAMDREQRGGWVYIMANRYRGAIYVGVTSDLSADSFKRKAKSLLISSESSEMCRFGRRIFQRIMSASIG